MIPYRRESVLRELGCAPLWRLRSSVPTERHDVPAAAGAAIDAQPEPVAAAPVQEPPPAPARIDERPAPGRRTEPVGTSVPRQASPSSPPPSTATDAATAERAARIGGMDWNDLEAEIRNCRVCRLCEKRRQAVPGVGDRKARWLFVGEGPGAEEDQRGEPFVGAAGRLLDNMLASIGLRRGEDVYIANVVKCRPPHNRTPEADEVAACWPFLARQIELLQPQLIVAMGRPAAQALLNTEVRIGAARGKLFDYRGIPVVVTYHPAYLLRNQWDKGKAWEDLCFARRQLTTAREG